MGVIFQGETKEFELKVKDVLGNVVDPAQLLNVKIFIYEQMYGKMIAQYSLVEEPGFNCLKTSGSIVKFVLSQAETLAASTGKNIIQVNLYLYDQSFENNTKISIQKGFFTVVKEAKA